VELRAELEVKFRGSGCEVKLEVALVVELGIELNVELAVELELKLGDELTAATGVELPLAFLGESDVPATEDESEGELMTGLELVAEEPGRAGVLITPRVAPVKLTIEEGFPDEVSSACGVSPSGLRSSVLPPAPVKLKLIA
jgi:hypothetical protein